MYTKQKNNPMAGIVCREKAVCLWYDKPVIKCSGGKVMNLFKKSVATGMLFLSGMAFVASPA